MVRLPRHTLGSGRYVVVWIGVCAAVLGCLGLHPPLTRARRDRAVVRAAHGSPSPGFLSSANALALRSSFLRTGGLQTRVGIQVGHWKLDEAPPELERLRDSTGAQAGTVREVIVRRPATVARAIASGLVRYFAGRPSPYTPAGRLAHVPLTYPAATVAAEMALRAGPDPTGGRRCSERRERI